MREESASVSPQPKARVGMTRFDCVCFALWWNLNPRRCLNVMKTWASFWPTWAANFFEAVKDLISETVAVVFMLVYTPFVPLHWIASAIWVGITRPDEIRKLALKYPVSWKAQTNENASPSEERPQLPNPVLPPSGSKAP